jgi:hypothetical protein
MQQLNCLLIIAMVMGDGHLLFDRVDDRQKTYEKRSRK